MTRLKNSLAERLLAVQVVIDNARSDEEIKLLIAEYGYDENRMNEGIIRLDMANQLQQKQQQEYGEQLEATGALKTIWDKVDKE